MGIFYEFELAVDRVTLIVTLRWYTTDDPAAEPFLTEEQRHTLTDPMVTPERIHQAVLDRAIEVKQGLALYVAVVDAFGSAQNHRIPVA